MNQRFLIVQKAGEHEANYNFRECLCLKRAFDRFGIESGIWGKGFPTFETPFEQFARDYDVIFVMENYDFDWLPNLSEYKQRKVFWSVDGHMVFDMHSKFVTDNKIDIVLNSNIWCVTKMREQTKARSEWFPNAFDDTLIYPIPDVKKPTGIGFCGSKHAKRDEAVQMLQRKVGLKYDEFVIGEEMVKTINSYLVHWNFNINNDINYRTFETCGCGTMLLTNYTDGINTIFDVGKEIEIYSTEEDLLKKVEYYLRNPDKAREMAKNGYQAVISQHTFVHRVQKLLDILSEPVLSQVGMTPEKQEAIKPENDAVLSENSEKTAEITPDEIIKNS